MANILPPFDLELLCRESDRAARWLIGRFRRPHHDHDDVRQDLLVDLFSRLKSFDPSRGSPAAFAGTVLAHRRARLANRLRREGARQAPVSLDAPRPGAGGVSWGDTLAEDAGYLAVMGQPTDRFAAVERRLDLDRALGLLPRSDLLLCADLSHRTPTELCREGRTSRASLYRRVAGIRHALLAAGLRAS